MTREDEHRLASFFARPGWADVRQLVEQIAPGATEAIDSTVRRVRLEQWGDRSQ